jgi:hypothetical protein
MMPTTTKMMTTVLSSHLKNLLIIQSSENADGINGGRVPLTVATGKNSQPYPIAWSQSPKPRRRCPPRF